MDDPKIKVLAQETLTDGYLHVERFRLRHSRFDGTMSNDVVREVCIRGNAVGALLYDPDRDMVVLVEQFRTGAAAGGGPAWLMEIVAGMIGPGEHPEDVAAREAMEEAGADVTALEPICTYFPSPGVLSEKVWLYCCRVRSDALPSHAGLSEEDEDIRVHVLPSDEAFAMMDQNRLHNSVTIIALGWLHRHRARLRDRWTDAKQQELFAN